LFVLGLFVVGLLVIGLFVGFGLRLGLFALGLFLKRKSPERRAAAQESSQGDGKEPLARAKWLCWSFRGDLPIAWRRGRNGNGAAILPAVNALRRF
jgi:hypothetical protein